MYFGVAVILVVVFNREVNTINRGIISSAELRSLSMKKRLIPRWVGVFCYYCLI